MILLITLLVIKHFVCDFVLQTGYMIKEKGTYGALGGIEHALFHAVGTLLVLVVMMPHQVMLCVFCAGLDGIMHYHIDWVKCYLSQDYSQSQPQYWWLFGADQMLHYLTYIIILLLV